MKANPEAVVTVGPYKPIAEFFKLARQAKMDAVFVAISFVGPDALRPGNGRQGGRRRDRQPSGAISGRHVAPGGGILSGGARRARP